MPGLTGAISGGSGVLGFLSAKRGNDLIIAGLRQAKEGITAASDFNTRIDQINTNRELGNLSREIGRVTATNRASLGASGVDLASQSALSILSDNLARVERTAQDILSSQQIRSQAREFEASQQRFGLDVEIAQTKQKQVERNRQALLSGITTGASFL